MKRAKELDDRKGIRPVKNRALVIPKGSLSEPVDGEIDGGSSLTRVHMQNGYWNIIL